MTMEAKYKMMTEQLRLTNSDEEVANYLRWIITSDTAKEYWENNLLNKAPVMRSLLLKYQEEWKKAKANSKRTTKGGYEKVDPIQWGKMEAFAMIMDDLARMQ